MAKYNKKQHEYQIGFRCKFNSQKKENAFDLELLRMIQDFFLRHSKLKGNDIEYGGIKDNKYTIVPKDDSTNTD